MRTHLTRIALIGLEIFLGITAVFGGIYVVPTLPREWLVGTPFPDYMIPALALTVVVGGGALLAATLLVLHPEMGALVSLLVGLAIAIFEVVETTVMGLDIWLHALGAKATVDRGTEILEIEAVPSWLGIPLPLWLQPFYFVLGLVIMALALHLWTHQARGELRAQPAGQ